MYQRNGGPEKGGPQLSVIQGGRSGEASRHPRTPRRSRRSVPSLKEKFLSAFTAEDSDKKPLTTATAPSQPPHVDPRKLQRARETYNAAREAEAQRRIVTLPSAGGTGERGHRERHIRWPRVVLSALALVGIGAQVAQPVRELEGQAWKAVTTLVGANGQPGKPDTNPKATAPAKPNASPTVQPNECNIAGPVEACTLNGQEYNVPLISGLSIKIVDNGTAPAYAEYVANADNQYGLKTGEYAGRYVAGVTMPDPQNEGQDRTTGGIVLVDKVGKKLVESKKGLAIALPVDITNASNISISTEPYTGSIIIHTNGQDLKVTDDIPDQQKFWESGSVFGNQYRGYLTDYQRFHWQHIVSGEEDNYLQITLPASGAKPSGTYAFGNTMGHSNGGDVYVGYGITFADSAHIINNMVTINGVPVFLATNN